MCKKYANTICHVNRHDKREGAGNRDCILQYAVFCFNLLTPTKIVLVLSSTSMTGGKSSPLIPVVCVQRSEKRLVNLVKQDPGSVMQNS